MLQKEEPMLDLAVLCPHCEEQIKLNRFGLEAKEFIQCPHCRKLIKVVFADLKKKAIRLGPDFED